MRRNSREYIATSPVEELVNELESKIVQWPSSEAGSQILRAWVNTYWRNFRAYYDSILETASPATSLGFGGAQGELVQTIIPQARTLIQQYVAILTRQRLSYEIVTDVEDTNPLISGRLGKALVNNLVEVQHLDSLKEKAAEIACVTGMSFVSCLWRTDSGYIYSSAGDGTANYSGNVVFGVHDVYDVIFDWSIQDWKDARWCILRVRKNRWDLIAQYPDLKEEILRAPSAFETRNTFLAPSLFNAQNDPDEIYINEYYHAPTPALPFGRMTVFCGSKCVLFDSPNENPYGCLPIQPVIFQRILNTGLGYPLLSSLLPAQEMLNHSYSVVSSNQSAFGVQSVLLPRGADIDVEDLKGLTFISYRPQSAEGGGKPEPLQLTATPPEVFNFIDRLEKQLGNLSMVNETLRGSPPPNVTSGAMAATLSANALEFMSSAAKALHLVFESMLNLALKNYQKFASVEQILDVVGEGKISYVQSFKGEEIKYIKRIQVKQGNPILSSIAGRLQLGEAILPLLQQGASEAINKYLGLLEGEPVDSLFESELTENAAVQAEIEALLQGQPVTPLITDNHPLFIRAYRKLLYNPQVRTQNQLTNQVLQVMQERISLEQQCPPELKAMLRGTPPGPMGGGGGPPSAAMGAPTPEQEMGADPAQPAEPQV